MCETGLQQRNSKHLLALDAHPWQDGQIGLPRKPQYFSWNLNTCVERILQGSNATGQRRLDVAKADWRQ